MSEDDTDFDYGALVAESEIDDEALLDFDPEEAGLEDFPEVEEELTDPDPLPPEPAAEDEAISDQDGPDEEPLDDELDDPLPPEPIEEASVPETETFAQVRALDPIGAPIVAVCGLNGGCGTTTLTMLLAYAAAQQKRGPVLLTDLGGPSASMAAYLSKRGQHSLSSAANQHRAALFGADGRIPFAELSNDLRLMAREPGLADDEISDPNDPYLYDLLVDAQEDHFATFIDCGRLEQPGEVAVAEHATHIVWVVDGTPSAARRARAALKELPFKGTRSSILVIRIPADEPLSSQAEDDLRQAADSGEADMIMCGDAGDIVAQGIARTARNAIQPVKAAIGRIFK